MISKKSLLISVLLLFFVSNVSMAEMCARLDAVSAGEDHTLALMDDNTLWACGSNGYGQSGLGSGVPYVYSLQQVKGEGGNGYLKNIIAFDAGWYHSLAADANGTLWAWGTDSEGQLGNGPNDGNWAVPQKVHGIDNIGYLSDMVDIVYVSAGRSGEHSLVVDSNGFVYGFGLNDNGQCGDGTSGTDRETPVLVLDDDPQTTDVYLGDIATIIQADAGKYHSIALDNEGHVWEWGQNNGYLYPQKVPGVEGVGDLNDIVGISTCEHSVAVDSNGFVYEWKDGNPYKVPGGEMGTTFLENIAEVGAGSDYSMARTREGRVLIWDVVKAPKIESPVYVEDGEMETDSGLLEGIVAIGAGYYNHKIAICENGYGWAWGTDNGDGKLGVGDNDPHLEPTRMVCAEVSGSIDLAMTHEILGNEPNCVKPFVGLRLEDNYLEYEICYGNPITNTSDPDYYGSLYDVNIIDHLPIEVNEPNYISGGGVYDSNAHTITWVIGELAPGDANCFTVRTKVNGYARPGGEISNFVEMISENTYYSYATDTLEVCNWGGEIIYVDQDATNGFDNGTSWENAYIDLKDAFAAAQNLGADVTAIWVAGGAYKPIGSILLDGYKECSFELLEDVALFGHFAGTEESTAERDFADANNETILDGQIGENVADAVAYVVKAEGIEDGLIDGFTVRNSYSGVGVYIDDANIAVANCKLKNNHDNGIQAKNYSYCDIHNCLFEGNTSQGIIAETGCNLIVSYCSFDGNDVTADGIDVSNQINLDVQNSVFKDHVGAGIRMSNGELVLSFCKFDGNNENGLDLSNVDTIITNNIINNSNWSGISTTTGCSLVLKNSIVRYSGDCGINLNYNTSTNIVNSWIHNNGTNYISNIRAGVYCNNHTIGTLNLRNNTIYDNYTYGIECGGYGADPYIRNCIIAGNDSNDLYRENGSFNRVNYCLLQNGHAGTGNITGDPCFVNIDVDSNDLHIDVNSQCKDAGDPNGSYEESDIDGEDRVYYGRVDMGADEYYLSPADFDNDGIVNFMDYSIFAAVWQSEPNDAGYNDNCDLVNNNLIDVSDLAAFSEDWLWKKGWDDAWMMCMDGGGGSMLKSSVIMDRSLLSVSESSVVSSSVKKSCDGLMLGAVESLAKRPARLAAKSQKFYDITTATTITAKHKELDAVKAQAVSIKEVLKLLDEFWLAGEFDKALTEKEYKAFREAIEKSDSF